MTSLNIIEQFLNIQIGNKRLMKGKNDEEKNKYYFWIGPCFLYLVITLNSASGFESW